MAKPSDSTTLAKPTDTSKLRTQPKDLDFAQISKGLFDAGDIVSASEFGNGFAVLETKDKGQLVGVPFIILDWTLREGDNGDYVSLEIVTQDNRKLIVNDGSTGILKQIRDIAETGDTRAIYVKKGLRKSEYTYTDGEGKQKPAVTFYLDTSA